MPEGEREVARDLGAMREGGWEAVELWLRHWDGYLEGHSVGQARRLLDEAGLVAAGGCAQSGLFFAEGEEVRRYRDELRRRLEQCQALGAAHLVVTPGMPGRAGPERLSAALIDQAAEQLRAAGEMAREYGVRLGIEFLKGARFVNNLPTALLLAERTAHFHVGVLVDTFHLYAGLSKVEDLELLRGRVEQLTFVHLNDVPPGGPRELWVDADRVLPGEGGFPLTAIFDRLRAVGFGGYVSLELFNEQFASEWGADPAAAARRAFESVRGLVQQ